MGGGAASADLFRERPDKALEGGRRGRLRGGERRLGGVTPQDEDATAAPERGQPRVKGVVEPAQRRRRLQRRGVEDEAVGALLQAIAATGEGSFLAVLKTFGARPPAGTSTPPR